MPPSIFFHYSTAIFYCQLKEYEQKKDSILTKILSCVLCSFCSEACVFGEVHSCDVCTNCGELLYNILISSVNMNNVFNLGHTLCAKTCNYHCCPCSQVVSLYGGTLERSTFLTARSKVSGNTSPRSIASCR